MTSFRKAITAVASGASFASGAVYARSAAVLLSVFLVACSSQESRVGRMLNLNTDFILTVEAAAQINPSSQDEAAPVFLRLYELSSDEAFEEADFIDLYEREKAVLGDSLIKFRQLPRVAPNEVRDYEMVLNSETRFVGILAEFYQYEDASYKIVVPVTSKNVFRDRLRVRISGNDISLVQ